MAARSPASALWMPDDTEEDLVGADWHQETITALMLALQQVAETTQLPWHVGNQMPLVARHPDGSPWIPCPDVMLHAQAGPTQREHMRLDSDGPPALVVEVLSRSTWRRDVGADVRGVSKGREYLACGVHEYLVVDPHAAYMGQMCRGWRLRPDQATEEWLPDATGRYVSRLGVAFAVLDGSVRVLGPDGALIPHYRELAAQKRQAERLYEQAEQRLQHEAQTRMLAEERLQHEAQARTLAEQARVRAEEEVARLQHLLAQRSIDT